MEKIPFLDSRNMEKFRMSSVLNYKKTIAIGVVVLIVLFMQIQSFAGED